ncbi:MAG TPA: HAMP domain-containing sensor histidine kinase [Acidobacteriaceae bacterium]
MIRIPRRGYRFSLRARATSWYVGLLAVALVVFSIGTYLGLRTYMKVSLQRALIGTTHTIANDFLAKLPAKGDAWVLGEVRESYASSPTDHYVRLSVGDKVLYQTDDMLDPSIQIGRIALPGASGADTSRGPFQIGDIALPTLSTDGTFRRQTIEGREVLTYFLPFQTADGRIIEVEAGTSLYSLQQTMRSLTKILIAATILILIPAAVGGYFLMKQPLRPLIVLTDKAANIGRKELGERLPVIPTGDELERLTHSLNGMIDRLEEALSHNHRFSADASHELRTPLTIMRGELEEMLRIEDLPAQAVENLISTLDEIDRMSRIVNSLMVITRLDAGSERLDMEVLNLSTLVRTTMDHMKLLAEEKGLPLTCLCDRDVFIHAAPMRIKQVLVNLIDNAIKYTLINETSPESVLPEVSCGGVDVTVFASGSNAVLKITDQGVGIAPEVLPHVFERFYRADFARSRGAGGVGLGLAIVKAIVSAHDGTVSIASTLGQGSTVIVELPLVPPPATPAITEESNEGRKQPRYQTT